jgi:hypothetical protein
MNYLLIEVEKMSAININQTPPAGKAQVFIFRDSAMGFALQMEVFIDEQSIGKTWAKSFLYAVLEPGHHILLSKSENKATIELDAQAGQTYFVQQQVKMGALYARSKLELMDEAKAKKKMAKLKQSKAQK